MADTHKHSDKEPHAHGHEKAEKLAAKAPAKEAKPAAKPAAAKDTKGTSAPKKADPAPKAPAAKGGAAKKAPAKAPAKEPVKIVEKATPKYQAQPKAKLTEDQKHGLALRRSISDRRPWFRRQQWYEYKRLADSGWRKPTGVDSAQRRHFGYEQPVVRIGFGGPKSVRGLHSSGFREVYVEQLQDLQGIDKATQAARVSGKLGARKLKIIYAEADKLGVRVLNRRKLE